MEASRNDPSWQGSAPATTRDAAVPTTPAPHAAPVTLKERIEALDVIRGFALFGILVVNMAFFGGPLSYALINPTLIDGTAVERGVWWIEQTFFFGKFVSTFSFLFGVGLTLQMLRLDRIREESLARGVPARNTGLLAFRRLFILGLFGIAHGLGLWYGDILFFYAVFGLILIPLRYLSGRVCLIIAVCLIGLSTMCTTGLTLLQTLAPDVPQTALEALPDGPVAVQTLFDRLEAIQFNTTDPRFAPVEIAIYSQGPWQTAYMLRLVQWATMVPFMLIGFTAHLVSLLVLGMAAAKLGFFARDRGAWQRRAAIIGLTVGTVVSASGATMMMLSNWDPGTPGMIGGAVLQELGTFLLSIGYIGLLTCLVHGGVLGPILRFVANAGRMAFTIYLTETFLMTMLMYWWGFGYFGSFTRLQHFGIAIVTWLALVAFANVWLSIFRMGPLEWVWRAGTYLELPSMKKGGG